MCLAAVALKEGHEVKVVDAAAENLTVDETVQEVVRFRPDVIGISATTVGIVAAGELAASVRRKLPDALTAVGGPHVTALPAETLAEFPSVDMGVIGEGEETLVDLLSAVAKKKGVPSQFWEPWFVLTVESLSTSDVRLFPTSISCPSLPGRT